MLRAFKSFELDWLTIIIYIALVGFGYVNIISASHVGEITSYFDSSQLFGKQLIFIAIALILIGIILSIDARFYERFSSLIYLFSILSLIGLFVFGKDVNGAKSWYAMGGMTIQPSEFAKFATALAVAKFVSDIQTNVKSIEDQLRLVLIIFLPALLILLQNDAGSTLVYAAFFFVLYREGLQKVYLIIICSVVLICLSSLKFGPVYTILACFIVLGYLYFKKRLKKKHSIFWYLSILVLCVICTYGIKGFYDFGLKKHQQNRISIFLKLEKDAKKLEQMKHEELYNLIQSQNAISSGGLTGKGFLQGTLTTGKFVPEQHTDYIFSTVGEEWGFIGTSVVVLLFVLLILRILILAEKQKSHFSRVYGYGVAAIIFIHFAINIGMVMGLMPTIGIPLPFFSYGGSGLLAFTLLLFIFIKLDSNKVNEL